jgi:hypothetical protein
MALRADQFARLLPGGRDTMEVRPEAVRLNWSWPALTAGDGHELSVRFGCGIRAAGATADRQLLREALLGGREDATLQCVAALFDESLRATATALAAGLPAADLDDQARNLWQQKLTGQANRVAFAAGLEVLAPFELQIESRTLARISRVRRAGELLAEIQSVRSAHPDLPGGALLNQLETADRPEALAAMLLAEGRQPATALAVAGNQLIRIPLAAGEAGTITPAVQQEEIDPAIGPLRSVTPAKFDGRDVLILGGRAGLTIASLTITGRPGPVYTVANCQSPLGFSRALIDGDQLIARHGELGLLAWTIGDLHFTPTSGRTIATNAQLFGESSQPASGELALLNRGQYLISAGSRICRLRDGEISILGTGQTTAPVISLIARDADVLAIRYDASVDRIDRSSAQIDRLLPPRGPAGTVTSAAALPVAESWRLLLAGHDNVIRCVGLEDDLVSEYRSTHAGLRMLAGGAGWVIAVSGDRQRLILWQAHNGRQPAAEIHVTSLVRHRIAGIALI